MNPELVPMKSSEYALLRKMLAWEQGFWGPVCQILAKSLTLEGVIQTKTQIPRSSKPFLLYKHVATGEVFSVPDVQLPLSELVTAHYRLWAMYRDGVSVPQDQTKADKWFVKAAAYGIPPWWAEEKRNGRHRSGQASIQNQPRQNEPPVGQSQERTFTDHPGLRMAVILVCIVVAIVFVQQKRADDHARKENEARQMQLLSNQGYRLPPDGSTRMATQEELWREGTVYDYKYHGRSKDGKLIEIYGMKGQQKVFGKFQGYDSGLVYGDISVQGEWLDKGKIKARDAEGNDYEIEITDKE